MTERELPAKVWVLLIEHNDYNGSYFVHAWPTKPIIEQLKEAGVDDKESAILLEGKQIPDAGGGSSRYELTEIEDRFHQLVPTRPLNEVSTMLQEGDNLTVLDVDDDRVLLVDDDGNKYTLLLVAPEDAGRSSELLHFHSGSFKPSVVKFDIS